MAQSFSSWNLLNESIAKGKEILTINGKTHKVKYRVQSRDKFLIKIVNDLDILDSTGKLTSAGEEALIAFFNAEPAFTSQVGQITPAFFEKNFIVYLVRKDSQNASRQVQKIQFSVEPRLDSENNPKYPEITQSDRFVDEARFKGTSKEAEAVLTHAQTLLTKTKVDDPEVVKTDVAPEATQDTRIIGKKFLYTMRTNNKIYLMEFTADNKLKATTQDGSDPNGEITYMPSSGESTDYTIFWDTDLDDSSRDTAISKRVNATLHSDGTLYNNIDRKFIHRMFTDTTFRNEQLKIFEDEYKSSLIDAENLKRMLFHKDGTSIFQQSKPSGEKGGYDRERAMGELQKAIQKTIREK